MSFSVYQLLDRPSKGVSDWLLGPSSLQQGCWKVYAVKYKARGKQVKEGPWSLVVLSEVPLDPTGCSSCGLNAGRHTPTCTPAWKTPWLQAKTWPFSISG